MAKTKKELGLDSMGVQKTMRTQTILVMVSDSYH